MKKTITLLATLVAVTGAVAQNVELPKAKVTVRVVDENKISVAHANVSLGFGRTSVKGITDAKGYFTGAGIGDVRGVGCTITKAGYYTGTAPIPRFQYNELSNRWEPWDETYTAVLRSVGRPVALYAKKVQADIPVLGQPCGYDLEAGDWVAPYGKGMKKDLIFTIRTKNVKDARNFDAQGELTFANPRDGLQEASISVFGKRSEFKWEQQAPGEGYQPKLQLQNTWQDSLGQKPVSSFKFDDTEWEGYFFRVRTVEQDGNIVRAHYGKIRGGIEIEPRGTPTCTIIFTYYFNPTSLDRNLEWDMKRNLFGNLTFEQTPREP